MKTNNIDGLWWKIPDTGYNRNPYDSWCLVRGKFYAMEQKINKSVKTFNFKTFFRDRLHEIDCLKRVEMAGGTAYVTINHYIPRKVNTAYALPISVAQRALNKGSVTLKQIQDHPEITEIPRIKNEYNEWVWDLSFILK